ncbi:MAG: hypothetical protein ACRCVU_11835 [Flavobacterium sp.]
MKKTLAILFLLIGFKGVSQESTIAPTTVMKIESLMSLFENEDREGIAKRVVYPLKREYPIPEITTEFEFVSRFEQLFIPEFSSKIAHSVIAEYSPMGWRGIMFDLGRMWLTEDGDILRINDQTEAEKDLRNSLIQADKKKVHRSVNKFLAPYAVIKIGQDIWRVDRKNKDVMRLVIWIDGKTMAEAPDQVLEGTEEIQGTMANRVLEFTDKKTQETITILMDNPESTVRHEVVIIIKDNESKERKLIGLSDN